MTVMENLDQLLETIKGINPIFLIIGFFLFKDQIMALFNKPTTPVPTPTPTPVPVPTPAPAPVDRPVIDAIITQVLPVLLPIVIKLIIEQIKSEKEKEVK